MYLPLFEFNELDQRTDLHGIFLSSVFRISQRVCKEVFFLPLLSATKIRLSLLVISLGARKRSLTICPIEK